MNRRQIVWAVVIIFILVIGVLFLSLGGKSTSPGRYPVRPIQAPVTSLSLMVDPTSIPPGTPCGTTMTFTYTAVAAFAPHSQQESVDVEYTTNSGRTVTTDHITVAPDQKVGELTFATTFALPPDHTRPGVAEIRLSEQPTVRSQPVLISGSCS